MKELPFHMHSKKHSCFQPALPCRGCRFRCPPRRRAAKRPCSQATWQPSESLRQFLWKALFSSCFLLLFPSIVCAQSRADTQIGTDTAPILFHYSISHAVLQYFFGVFSAFFLVFPHFFVFSALVGRNAVHVPEITNAEQPLTKSPKKHTPAPGSLFFEKAACCRSVQFNTSAKICQCFRPGSVALSKTH